MTEEETKQQTNRLQSEVDRFKSELSLNLSHPVCLYTFNSFQRRSGFGYTRLYIQFVIRYAYAYVLTGECETLLTEKATVVDRHVLAEKKREVCAQM